MKKINLVFALLFFFSAGLACTARVEGNSKSSFETKNLSPQQLQKSLTAIEGVQLVDVRTDEEWQAGHLKGALHLPGVAFVPAVSHVCCCAGSSGNTAWAAEDSSIGAPPQSSALTDEDWAAEGTPSAPTHGALPQSGTLHRFCCSGSLGNEDWAAEGTSQSCTRGAFPQVSALRRFCFSRSLEKRGWGCSKSVGIVYSWCISKCHGCEPCASSIDEASCCSGSLEAAVRAVAESSIDIQAWMADASPAPAAYGAHRSSRSST